MDNIKANFYKLFNVVKEIMGKEIDTNSNLLRPGPKPGFADIEGYNLKPYSRVFKY